MHTSSSQSHMEYDEQFNLIDEMVGDAFGVNVTFDEPEDFDVEEEAQRFYQFLKEMNMSLFEGSSNLKSSMCVRLLASKSNWNVPNQCLEFFAKMMLDVTPTKDNLLTSFYDAKRLVSKLSLKVRKIYCCISDCMLFYDNEFDTSDGALLECKLYKSPRYKVRSKAINLFHMFHTIPSPYMHLRGPCTSPTTHIPAHEEDNEGKDEEDHGDDHEGHNEDDNEGHDRAAHLSEYQMIDGRCYIRPSGNS
ncbi:hypothetical protein KIW84_061905 [Lathyrus oleraceus]|uniref:Uncharacterized protein n=1 Tax=Pisum sativum TaxID=3888 RepID=A0A9D5A544_PEA|nr:hypothetical protein KIW84_061905 [Pisum sativum]